MINPEVIVYIKNGFVYYNDNKAFVKQVPKTYTSSTPTGVSVSLNPIAPTSTVIGVDIQFDEVDGSGTTNVTQVTEFSNPTLPNTFSIGDAIAVYQVNTTASFVGDITLCFTLPEGSVDSATFSTLRIFHKDGNGDTNDVTILTGPDAPDFATRKICAKFSSFSEFYIIPEQTSPYPYPTYFVRHSFENKEISW
jgi:hypothetical protein